MGCYFSNELWDTLYDHFDGSFVLTQPRRKTTFTWKLPAPSPSRQSGRGFGHGRKLLKSPENGSRSEEGRIFGLQDDKNRPFGLNLLRHNGLRKHIRAGEPPQHRPGQAGVGGVRVDGLRDPEAGPLQ